MNQKRYYFLNNINYISYLQIHLVGHLSQHISQLTIQSIITIYKMLRLIIYCKTEISCVYDVNDFFSNCFFSYECGLARLFEDPYTNRLYTERTIQCNWNGTWTPVDYLDHCVWIACLNPPMVNKINIK